MGGHEWYRMRSGGARVRLRGEGYRVRVGGLTCGGALRKFLLSSESARIFSLSSPSSW